MVKIEYFLFCYMYCVCVDFWLSLSRRRTRLTFKTGVLGILIKSLFYWNVSMVILAPVMLLSNVLLSGFVFSFLLKVWTTIGTCIANEIGNPLMVDAPKSGLAWGPFLHIRVDIDITKPLMRGKMIHIEYVKNGGSFLNMRGCQLFAIIVVYLVIGIVNVKILKKVSFH